MMRSLYSAVSGLRNHQTRMDVIGNNISNVNTVAFKSSSVTFSDIVYQTLSGASGANANVGGVNAKQIGLGMSTASTAMAITSAGSAQSTGGAFDLRIADGGSSTNFFIVNTGTEQVYTRDGSFYIDGAGTLCMSSTGYQVMGWGVDQTTGEISQGGGLRALKIMETENLTSSPEATTDAYASGIIDKNTPDLTSSTGYVMELPFYDDEGYSYTAKFKVTTENADAGQYRIKLSQILNQDGDNILQSILGANNITLGNIFGTPNPDPKNLDSGIPARRMETLSDGANINATVDGTTTTYTWTKFGSSNLPSSVDSSQFDWNRYASQGFVGMMTVNGTNYFVDDQANFHSFSSPYDTVNKSVISWEMIYPGYSYAFNEIDASGSDVNLTLTWIQGGTSDELREGWYFVPASDATDATNPYKASFSGTDDVVTWKGTDYPNPTSFLNGNNLEFAGYFIQPSTGNLYVASTDGTLFEYDSNSGNYYQSSNSFASVLKDFDTDQDGITISDKTMTVTYTYFNMNFHTSDGSFDTINGDPRYAQLTLANRKLPGASESPFSNIRIDFSKLQNVNNNKKSTANLNNGESATSTIGSGKKLGALIGVAVQNDGRIYGSYDNGNTVLLGQIAAAQFSNASGLQKVGDGCYQTTLNSGDATIVDISADGSSMSSGELEMSNVDLSAEFTDMITTQRGFQANSRVITTSDSMLEELINLKR